MESETNRTTYVAAGVDRNAAKRSLAAIKSRVQATFGQEVLTDLGAFAGLFQLAGYRNPVLVSSVDGVGTKVKIAIALDRHNTVGIDLVNHCVNDIFTCGAIPLFFLDYIAMGKLIPERVENIVAGLASACEAVGCALIGGETAEMPGIYTATDYDLAGFIVGVQERENILRPGLIESGDAILGLPSSGLHTNGYSLVRKIFRLDDDTGNLDGYVQELGRTLGEELLEPHRCYYNALKNVVHSKPLMIKGLAHITGGGIPGNVNRIIPDGLVARFFSSSWSVPPLFTLIEKKGSVEKEEMYHVFNMGLGIVVVCSQENVESITCQVPEAKIVGEIIQAGDYQEKVIIE